MRNTPTSISAGLSFFYSVGFAIVVLIAIGSSSRAHAASDSWIVDASGNWNLDTNWSAGAPGSTTTDNSDVATFNTTLTAIRTVTVDANRYIGGITFDNPSTFRYQLNTGTLHMNSGSVIQTLAGNGNHTDTINSPIRISGEEGTLTITAGATSASSLLSVVATSVSLTGNSSVGNVSTLTLNGANTGGNAIYGSIGDGDAGGKLALVKDGGGLWVLRNTNANTYSGPTTINSGTLQIGLSSTTGSLPTGSVIGGSGGTLAFRRTDAVTQGTHFGSVIGGSIGVNQLSGVLTLNGNNTFSGGVAVSSGTLNINSAGSGGTSSAIGTGTLTIGAVTINNTSEGPVILSTANPVAMNGNFTFGGTQDLTIAGPATTPGTRTITLNGTGKTLTLGVLSFAASNANSLTVNGSGNKLVLAGINLSESGTSRQRTVFGTAAIEITGAIADGGESTASSLVYSGGGTLTLSGESTYGGLMRVTTGGRLVLKGGDNRLPTTSALWLGVSNETIGATLQLGDVNSASNQTLGSLNTNGSGVFAVVGGGSNITSTLTVSGSGRFGGTIGGTGVNQNNLALTKSGIGTLTLNGSNTYTGRTLVSGGELFVNGSLDNTEETVVDVDAVLGGSGVIQGLVSISGTLSPGNSPGIISLGSLLLTSTATSLIEINAAGTRGVDFDGITILDDNGLTYGGLLLFVFGETPVDDNTIFDIFSFGGAPSGSFSSVVSTGFYDGTWVNNNDGTYSLVKDSQTLTFSESTGVMSVVPEPGALALMGIGLVMTGVVAARRRRFAISRAVE